ncbi:Thiosulfate sulfurtransferase, rhodanese [invertebrate metagenome]|uniref:Thiosulfate sulfurtransferase, rhodanese n=1 Tax=invertebrate metagenome TaxID=1711999 RepID=A0A484HB60_9ZZZZ
MDYMKDYTNPDGIVSTEWLAQHLYASETRVVDASWWPQGTQRNGREEYLDTHIPGAVFFDIDDIADSAAPLPRMLPPAEVFANKVERLGLGDEHHIIIYDNVGGASAAARAWWMFRVFGHTNVAVLAGGFPKWLREQRTVEETVPILSPALFKPRQNLSLLRSLEQVREDLDTHLEQIIDGRRAERYHAQQHTLGPGSRAGHIPGSINLPVLELVDQRELTLLPADSLQQCFESHGVDLNRPVIATCGEGVTCCLITLGLYLLGKTDVANYDGSWVEWDAHDELPRELEKS